MKVFDFTLSRPKDYYFEKMNSLEAEYEQRGKYIGKRYLKGIHFKYQGEKTFGYFCAQRGYYSKGLCLPFYGRFIEGKDASLHFHGFVYPQIAATLSIIALLLIVIFLVSRVELILIASAALVADIVSYFIYSPTVIKELEDFFK